MPQRASATNLQEVCCLPLTAAAVCASARDSGKAPLVISAPDDIAFQPQDKKTAFSKVAGRFAAWLAEEEAYGSRFLFFLVCAGAGVIAYFSAGTEPTWEQLLLLAACMTGLIYLFRHLRILMLLFGFMLFGVLGALCAKMESARLATVMIGGEVSTFITGRIVALEETEKGGYVLVLDVVTTEKPQLRYPPGRVRLTTRRLPDHAGIGTGLKGRVRLRPPSGPARSGVYDFSFHYYYRGIGAQGFFMGMPAPAAIPPPEGLPGRLEIRIAQLRSLMTQRITNAVAGEAGAVSAALITGQRGGISRSANDALRLSGLAHILSISGLHMAMVTGMVLVTVRAILGLFPSFSMRYPPAKIAAVIALAVSGFYLMLSGADVAAQRSFVMVAVMLLAVLFDRPAITMRNLAIAALITILVVPHEILGPSFQMSFAATAALVAVFGWWSERRRLSDDTVVFRHRSLLLRWTVVPLVSTGVASLVAGTASGLFAAFHFNNTAPLGILGNALAFPVMSVMVMPFALIAAILMPVQLEWLPLQVMGAGVTLVQKIAFGVAAISPHVNPGVIPPGSLVVLAAGLVMLMFLRSPLRFVSLPLFVYGLLVYGTSPLPLALVAENGRVAAAVYEGGKLAVHAKRPPGFIMRNWMSAFHTKSVAGPQPMTEDAADTTFRCTAGFCHIRLADGKVFTIALQADNKKKACAAGDVVFLDMRGQGVFCPGKITITRQKLALYGTAEIHATAHGLALVWASGLPERPWNAHRRYSKTARGMP